MIFPKIKLAHEEPKDAPEVVKFEFMGDRKMVFSRDEVSYVVEGLLVSDRGLAYRDIEWVGSVREKQRWGLVMAVVFIPFCLIGMAYSEDRGGVIAGVILMTLCGLIPLAIYLRGRPFLVVSTPFAAIKLPMDRSRRQIRRVIGLLRTVCPANVRWELPGPSPGALSSDIASPKIDEMPAADPAVPASSD